MSQIGVYKLYSLGRMSGNSFNKDIKVLTRDLHAILNDYAEDVNYNSHSNGLLYEKDENATKLYLSGKPFKAVKEYANFEEVKEVKKVEAPIEDTIFIQAKKQPVIEGDVKELKKIYEDLSGVKAKQMWGVKKLNEEINKLKTE